MIHYTLYYAPGACSVAAHVALEMLQRQGLARYTACKLLLPKAEHKTPEYLAINPRGKVPALALPDGAVLTETLAILRYLHATYPQAGLLPADALTEARGWEWLSWLSSHVQSYAFMQVFYPVRFGGDEAAQVVVEANGRALLEEAWADLEARLPATGFALGGFSVVDAHLLTFFRWAKRYGFYPQRRHPKWAALANRVLAQEPVATVFTDEGINLHDPLPPRPAHLKPIPADAMQP
jgi:glutathione S-transferase